MAASQSQALRASGASGQDVPSQETGFKRMFHNKRVPEVAASLPKQMCWERVICPGFVARQMSGLFGACSWGGTCDDKWRYGVFS